MQTSITVRDNRRVLVVDDDPAMRRLLTKLLVKAGYEVREAADGREALDLIDVLEPDFLVTDWDMPNLTGLELCSAVRQRVQPNYLYIVLLTAKNRSDDIVRGLDAGADDFVSKPIVPGELLARLQAGARVLDVERQLNRAAQSDPLTGILNRRFFHEQLDREWSRAVRYRMPLSIVLLDLDFFKTINDTYGHPAGDSVLCTIASTLQRHTRGNDFLCRYGGEEFCALLTDTAEREASFWCERIRAIISDTAVDIGEKELSVTTSIGVAERLVTIQNPQELIDRADQALLVAKQSGRNRVVRFSKLEDSGIADVESGNRQNNPFKGVLARDIMTTPVVCLHQDDTILRAAEFLLEMRINSAPVVDDEGNLAGITSEKDLMDRMTSPTAWSQPILAAMNTNVVSYDEDTPASVIFDFLQRVAVRRVVIVKDGRPTGVISRGNIVRWFKDFVVPRECPTLSVDQMALQLSSLS